MKRIIKIIAAGLVVSSLTSCALLNHFDKNVNLGEPDTEQQNDMLVSLGEILPGCKQYENVVITDEYPQEVRRAWLCDNGYVFETVGKGRNGDISLRVGIDNAGRVVGVKITSDNDLRGYTDMVFELVEGTSGAYTDMDYYSFEPYLVSGATLTSRGIADAVETALKAYCIINNLDVRSEEEKLQDNCNAALGTSGAVFGKWFATEVLEGIDKVYTAHDGSGFVFVIGERYIGVNASGVTTHGASLDDLDKVSTAYSLVSASTLTEIALPEGVSKSVTKAYVTAGGNYVFEVEAKGYDYYFEYSMSNQPIVFRVSISADGRIIDTVTLMHNESKGFGDVCATEEYCEGWIGAGAEDVKISSGFPDYMVEQIPDDSTDLGVIAGATYTTYGYQNGIKAAFDAFELLTA